MGMHITGRHLLPAFLFFFFSVSAQITFNKTIDFANGDEPGVSVVVLDDGYFIIGEGWGYEVGDYFDIKTKYTKIDNEGNTVYKKVIGAEGKEFYPGWKCIKTQDGNIVFAGGYVTLDDGDSDVQLLKIDPETGDTIFHKIYESENYQFGESIDEYSDGSLLINMYDEDFPTTLMKTNALGDITWQKSYGVSNEGTSSIINLTEDTLTLLTYFGSCEPLGYKWRTIDSSGDVIFEEFFEGACTASGRKSIGGGIIGTAVGYPDNPYITYIYRANTEGEFLWEYYSSWDLDTLYDFGLQIFLAKELPNGDMIIVGYYAANPIGSYRGFVSKINFEGEPYWERIYTSNGDPYDDNIIHDLAITYDGGMILAGAAYSNIFEEDQNFWVLKLDSMGCLTPGCDTLDDAVFELPFNKEFVLFPNPANDKIILQSGEILSENAVIFIYNISGELIEVTEFKKGTGTLVINTKNYIEGMYILKMQNENNNVLIKKFIVSR